MTRAQRFTRPFEAIFHILLACLMLAPLLTPFSARADQSVWTLDGDSNGIAIYTRQLPGNPLKDFKGVMEINAPIKQVVATLADVSTMHEWFFLLREARFLQGQGPNDAYVYMAINGIWPVRSRDVVAHVKVRQDPDTLAIYVDVESKDGILPPQAEHVRMPNLKSSWTLRPLSATRTAVELEGHGDPGGAIPMGLANMVVTTIPRQSMDKMRQYVMKSNYVDPEKLYAQSPPLRQLGRRLVFPS
ncbi:MAG: START domain-containing protein [Aquabacterium sp.]|uniref:START domain-containing protein n=1 Tax=Aquabacterium sp. TaxID=1872578 RepID=UPI0025C1CD8A|nr:START domain-containing protein [Aquabacterium sp.]MBI3384472.1 START domain-containing protein [Aquabacterium sp.]